MPRQLFVSALLILLFSSSVVGDDGERTTGKPIKKMILPGKAFLLQGRPMFIFEPVATPRKTGRPWVFYAATLPAYPDIHEKWMHEQFLKAGIAVAGIDVGEAYGSPASQKYLDACYREMVRRGFSKKPCLLGRSRGGLWVSSWAVRHPEKVAGLAGIYPVYDLSTYPGIERAAPAYQMTPRELEEKLDQYNPIEKMNRLALAKVPVYIIHGKDDKVVPLEQNSAELQRRYQRAGAGSLIEVQVIPGQGHNFWPGFFRCKELVQFVIDRANKPES